MRILFVAPYPPSPRIGGVGIRLYNTLRALAAKGEVTLVALSEKKHEDLLEDCRSFCREVVVAEPGEANRPLARATRSRWGAYREALGSWLPASQRFRDRSGLARLVERTADKCSPDLIWIAKSWIAGSLPNLDWSRTVVDFDDLEYRIMWRMMSLSHWYGSKIMLEPLEVWKQRRFERRLSRLPARATLCSERDRRRLRGGNVRVLRNCVTVPATGTHGPEIPHRLLLIGKMNYGPNHDSALFFCREILPLIRQAEPRAHVLIVGREPEEEIVALHTGTDIVVTGTVDDVEPYFAQAAIVVVPLRAGGGTRVKILEALARGKAVVSTTIGAEGLGLRTGTELYLADRASEFARCCVTLMADPAARSALGAAGRRRIEKEYGVHAFDEQVSRIVDEVLGAGVGQP
jgi:glycosyltransferase involved in cell wall biosynthesis